MKPIPGMPKFMLILMAFILVAYAMVRVVNLSQAVQRVKSTSDTPSYMRISRESILETSFLAGSRPLLFPLLLKVLGGHEVRVVWALGILSIISWSALAISVMYVLQIPFLKLASFGLILLLSLHRYVIGWDSVLLTESLSLSLMALFIAGWLWLASGWRWQKAVFLSGLAFLWACSRDTNAWVVLMIAFFLLLLAGLRLIDRRSLVLSVVLMVIFFLSNLSADVGRRWVFPFQNVMGHRILSNPQAVDYFTNCGMPFSPALEELTGEFANGLDRAFFEDPALADYRLWLHETGKACYVKWLLSRPLPSIGEPLAEFNTLMSLENISPLLFSRSFSPILPARLESILFPQVYLLPLFVVSLAMVLIAWLTKAWNRTKAWWVVIGMFALVFPHYALTWHGDIMGIYRHMLGVSLQFYLGFWLLALFGLDSIVALKPAQERPVQPHWVRNVEQ